MAQKCAIQNSKQTQTHTKTNRSAIAQKSFIIRAAGDENEVMTNKLLLHLSVVVVVLAFLTSSCLVLGNDNDNDKNDSIATTTVCPVVTSTSTAATVDTAPGNFHEISGLAVSTAQVSKEGNPIAFACNDSGDGPRLGVFDAVTAEHLLSLRLGVAIATDWEDLTLGPCTGAAAAEQQTGNEGDASTTGSCIYIADTGDNEARRSGGASSGRRGAPYRILQIREPVWTDYSDDDDDDNVIEVAAVLEFDYGNRETFLSSMGAFADCEALFLDPVGWGGDGAAPGDLYLVTKWGETQARYYTRVFYIPVSAWDETTGNAAAVYSPKAITSSVRAGETSSLLGPMWTSADMSPDGTLIALGAYEGTYLFLRCPGASVASVLTQPHCLFWPNPTPGSQTETIAWMPDGSSTLQIPEGSGESISSTSFRYDSTLAGQVCPRLQFDGQGTCRSVPENNPYPDSWCDASAALFSQAVPFPGSDSTSANNNSDNNDENPSWGTSFWHTDPSPTPPPSPGTNFVVTTPQPTQEQQVQLTTSAVFPSPSPESSTDNTESQDPPPFNADPITDDSSSARDQPVVLLKVCVSILLLGVLL